MDMKQAFIGIDVGTSSARAGVFDETGTLARSGQASDRDLARGGKHCRAVVIGYLGGLRRLGARGHGRSRASRPLRSEEGVGFDATCSLVVLDADGAPLTVSPSGEPQRNVIVWMDHRATAEAPPDQRHP